MTEEDAKMKRCCGPGGSGETRAFGIRYCIGSACMAWRTRDRYSHSEESNAEKRPEGAGWLVADDGGWVRPIRTKTGFCGLAGAPQ